MCGPLDSSDMVLDRADCVIEVEVGVEVKVVQLLGRWDMPVAISGNLSRDDRAAGSDQSHKEATVVSLAADQV